MAFISLEWHYGFYFNITGAQIVDLFQLVQVILHLNLCGAGPVSIWKSAAQRINKRTVGFLSPKYEALLMVAACAKPMLRTFAL